MKTSQNHQYKKTTEILVLNIEEIEKKRRFTFITPITIWWKLVWYPRWLEIIDFGLTKPRI